MISWKKHSLHFITTARTSRNELNIRDVWFCEYYNPKTGRVGLGECAPLFGLSMESEDSLSMALMETVRKGMDVLDDADFILQFPSIRFALESAQMSSSADDEGRLFHVGNSLQSIPINGLVWMNDKQRMLEEAFKKLEGGFQVIKLKIGGIAFEDELEILAAIRSEYSADKVVIRLDANGAFREHDVLDKLKALSKFDIHSIEQPLPIALNHRTAQLCREPIVPIALDESLIGPFDVNGKRKLLEEIAPQYIILKPSLHGGLTGADEWISIAEEVGVKWWATSALESSLGLDAIAQWVSAKSPQMHQGLGTGALYSNNLSPAWEVRSGSIFPLTTRPNWQHEIASIN